MTDCIVLTAIQANQVRGLSIKGHALAPVPLKDGTFVLPLDVLADPAHAAVATFLKTLPTRSVGFGTPPARPIDPVTDGELATDPVLLRKYAFQSSWGAGQLVAIST